MKAFLGFTQWYSLYVRGYAKLAAPLMESLKGLDVTKKQRKESKASRKNRSTSGPDVTPQEAAKSRNEIFWTEEMKRCFEELKIRFRDGAVLHQPDMNAPFYLRCDSSTYAVGGVIEQMGSAGSLRPVAFFSRKLQGKEGYGQRGWSIREKETYAIVATLYKFRSWLRNSPIKVQVLTDHESLQQWHTEQLDTMAGPIGRRGRWHQFLSTFDIEVIYVKGEDQQVPDILSRWSYPAHQAAPDVSIHGCETDVLGWEQDEQEVKAWADSELQFSRRVRRWVRAIGGTPSCRSRPVKRRLRALQTGLKNQCWSPSSFASATVHSPDALLLTDFPVASLRSGRARPKAVPKLAADVQVLFDDWTDSYLADPDLAGKFAALSSGISFWRDYLPQHVISGNKLRCAGKILVPAALVPRVIAAVHSYVHGGIEKTYQLVRRHFSVPSLKLDDLYAAVKTHCDACHVCQQSMPRVGVHPDSLHYYPIPDEPFSSLALDFLDLKSVDVNSVQYDCCMVVVCRLTGYVLAIPCAKAGLDSRQAAELFLRHCVFFMGLPQEFLCDNASILNSDFLTTLAELSGIEKYHSVIYRHNSNGRAESAVQGVMMALRKYLCQRGGDWYHALPVAVWGLNDLPGIVAPYSPHRLVFGRDPPGFGDCPPYVSEEGSEDALDFFSRLADERQRVKSKLESLHAAVAKRFSSSISPLSFEEGDRVWLRDLPKAEQKNFDKLKRVWQGPFEILKREGGNRYLVDTPQGPVCIVLIV